MFNSVDVLFCTIAVDHCLMSVLFGLNTTFNTTFNLTFISAQCFSFFQILVSAGSLLMLKV